ncbi:hypothetical protein ACYSNX_11920 [Myroides sp. LJL115]
MKIKQLINKFITTLFLFLLLPIIGFAQTGIHTQNVSENVVLQIHSHDNNKGLLLPRLTTAQRDQIPMTLEHNGMMIFNLDESCINYYIAGSMEWQSVCGQPANAEFTVTNCNNIQVSGVYTQEESLFKDHFITLEVEVQKPGRYSIVASSSPGNGYYFQTSGKFLNTGKFTIEVPAYGTPILGQEDTFEILLNGQTSNGGGSGCNFKVNVVDKELLPMYRMVCNTAEVFGAYKLHQPLNNSNYIKITLDVEPEAIGAMYEIHTDEIEGISFHGSGVINSYTQEVILYGQGTAYSVENKRFTLTSNSQKTSLTCAVDLKMIVPGKRLLTIGTGRDSFGYNFSGTAASNKLITEPRNYGTLDNSVVYFEGWKEIVGWEPLQVSERNLTDALLSSTPFDIVILGFSYSMNEAEAAVLAEYIKRGGVLLSYTESTGGMERFIRALTGDQTLKTNSGGGAGTVYRFTSTNDDILNGPFGDIRGKYWGEDASVTVVIPNLPQSDFEIYSGSFNYSRNTESTTLGRVGATAFRHKSYNFIWVGDGGFNSNRVAHSATICPFELDSNNYPIKDTAYGNGSTKFDVHNSIFTANAIAWAIYQSEVNGINSSIGKF